VKRLIDRHLSPATVISCIALFVSLGGVSYGVATGFIDTRELKDNTIRSQDVRNNSLRTQDIRNNEVRGLDIRNSTVGSPDVGLNSLTGSDILESTLGLVPQAAQAAQAGQAGLLDGIDSTGFVRTDGTGFAGIPFGPAGTSATGEPRPEFDVDPLGYAHLQGVIEADAPTGALAILPLGVRPAVERRFAVYGKPTAGSAAPTLVRVEPDGEIRSEAPAGAGDQIALDGITFRVGG